MASRAAVLLRSASKMQVGTILALLRPQLQRAAASVLSPRLLFNGSRSLPPMAAMSRLLHAGSVGRPELPNKNPLPPCKEPVAYVEEKDGEMRKSSCDRLPSAGLTKQTEKKKEELLRLLLQKSSGDRHPSAQLRKQVEEKKEELLHLLLQMDAERSPSTLVKEKCLEKEKLPHFRQEFQAQTEALATPTLDKLGNFMSAGIGAGFPGLQLGFGAGAGCGIGIGFGYAFGKGIAYDENGKYSNIRRPFQNSRILPSDEEFDILFDELMESTRRLIKATSKEIEKWRRM
ncbi:hypothetical protein ACP70R_036312 [Stipagrostis hirtigluma subsp. patula]